MMRSILVLAWLVANVARAQDEAALIDQGVTLREHGDDAGALELFRRAHAIAHSARALAQVGLAEQAVGRWADAHRDLAQALSSHDPWIEEHRAPLQSAFETTRARVGRLEIVGGIDGAVVSIDGHDVGLLPMPAPLVVDSGSFVLEVRAPGYFPLRRQVSVEAGSLAREQVELRPSGEAIATVATAPAGVSPIGPIILAVSGALAIGGIITGALTLDHDSQLARLCPANRCEPDARSILDERRVLAITTDVLFIGSALSAATGLLVTLLLHERAPDTMVGASCAPGGCGIALAGRWP